MSRVRARAYDLATKPASAEELTRRQQAEGRLTGLIAGVNGDTFEPPPVPTQGLRPTGWVAEEDTID